MFPNPWDPLGQALLDYHHGDTSAKVIVCSDYGIPVETPVRKFFRGTDNFPPLEKTALSLCRGRVLDIGAGTGCHALTLQGSGHSVCAIDVAPQAVEVMSLRGVRETHCADIFKFESKPFDTLLMMMNGIGIVENLDGLQRFFNCVKKLIKPDGRLILDSFDLREICSPEEIAARESDTNRGYFGEVLYQFGYRSRKGPEFQWLYIDADFLTDIAEKSGWRSEGIYQEDNGHYLTHLSHIQKNSDH